jgi:hypothetical protein
MQVTRLAYGVVAAGIVGGGYVGSRIGEDVLSKPGSERARGLAALGAAGAATVGLTALTTAARMEPGTLARAGVITLGTTLALGAGAAVFGALVARPEH